MTLAWTAVANALSYDYAFRQSGIGAGWGAYVNTTNTFAQVAPALPGTVYDYRVRVNSDDLSFASATGTFTTNLGAKPWNPGVDNAGNVRVSPSVGNADVSTMPLFTWNTALGATGFELICATTNTIDANGKLTASDIINLTGTAAVSAQNFQVTTALKPDTTYYWQVRAVAGNTAVSPWSDVFAFRTAKAPAPIPTTTVTEKQTVTETRTVTPVTTSTVVSTTVTSIVLPQQTTTVITQPVTTTVITQAPATSTVITVTQPAGTTLTFTSTVTQASTATPAWVWAIIVIGGVLLITVIVLIARTRKV